MYREFTEAEEKWLRSLQRVMKKAPETLFMFIGSGSMVIYPLKDDGSRYMTGDRGDDNTGGVDGDFTSMSIINQMECDGGDW